MCSKSSFQFFPNKATLHGNGFQALEWNDVMTPYYDIQFCVQKRSLFHQEDQLISWIFYSRAKKRPQKTPPEIVNEPEG